MTDHMTTLHQLKGRKPGTHDCPACSGPAYCAMRAGKSAQLCWCMSVETTHNPDTDADLCLCRACLAKEVQCVNAADQR